MVEVVYICVVVDRLNTTKALSSIPSGNFHREENAITIEENATENTMPLFLQKNQSFVQCSLLCQT